MIGSAASSWDRDSPLVELETAGEGAAAVDDAGTAVDEAAVAVGSGDRDGAGVAVRVGSAISVAVDPAGAWSTQASARRSTTNTAAIATMIHARLRVT